MMENKKHLRKGAFLMVSLNNILLEYIPDADGGFPIKERIDRCGSWSNIFDGIGAHAVTRTEIEGESDRSLRELELNAPDAIQTPFENRVTPLYLKGVHHACTQSAAREPRERAGIATYNFRLIQQIRIDFAGVEGLLATGIPHHTSIGVQVHLSVGTFKVDTEINL